MRILVGSGYGYWGDICPDDLLGGDRQIGGGETAMMQVSKELAKLGHEVIVFYDCPPGKYSGVDYLPTGIFQQMVCGMEHDVLVSWDNPYLFQFNDKAHMHAMAFQLNDAQVGIFDWMIDAYFYPSVWHMERFEKVYPEIGATGNVKVPCATNGIDTVRYSIPVPRVPHRVIYSSSPDRGLHHLLRMWPQIVERVPDATLEVFYDMQKWLDLSKMMKERGQRSVTEDRAEWLMNYANSPELIPPSVQFHGGVGQARLAQEQLKSSLMVYPCDPVQPTEGFSMSILEGITAGCYVITSDADALPELWSKSPGVTMLPLPVDDGVWVEAIVRQLNEPTPGEIRYCPEYSWGKIARRWEEVFNGRSVSV